MQHPLLQPYVLVSCRSTYKAAQLYMLRSKDVSMYTCKYQQKLIMVSFEIHFQTVTARFKSCHHVSGTVIPAVTVL